MFSRLLLQGKNMFISKPKNFINYSVCESECLIDAIKSDARPGIEK